MSGILAIFYYKKIYENGQCKQVMLLKKLIYNRHTGGLLCKCDMQMSHANLERQAKEILMAF